MNSQITVISLFFPKCNCKKNKYLRQSDEVFIAVQKDSRLIDGPAKGRYGGCNHPTVKTCDTTQFCPPLDWRHTLLGEKVGGCTCECTWEKKINVLFTICFIHLVKQLSVYAPSPIILYHFYSWMQNNDSDVVV